MEGFGNVIYTDRRNTDGFGFLSVFFLSMCTPFFPSEVLEKMVYLTSQFLDQLARRSATNPSTMLKTGFTN